MTVATNQCTPEIPDFEHLYIFGAGGFAREVAWLARCIFQDRIEISLLVDKEEYVRGPVNGFPVQLMSDASKPDKARYVIAIGDGELRRRMAAAMAEKGFKSTCLIHPKAEVSGWVDLDEGVIICAQVAITTNVKLGKHVHINLASTVGHDVEIGDYSTISPGAHLSGNVVLGQSVFVGTGVNIINGTTDSPLVIGDGAVLAAGACIVRSVEAGALMAGVPAMRKR